MKITKAAFIRAVSGGDSALVDAMLVSKPALASEVVMSGPRVMLGASVLGLAVYMRRWGVCMHLLDRGANVDYVPSQVIIDRHKLREWFSPLQLAIVKVVDVSQPGRDVEEVGVRVVERMVGMSGDINAAAYNGATALHIACSLLLGSYHKDTLDYYMWAIERVFKALLVHGANPKYSNDMVESAEKLYGHLPYVHRLLCLR